MTSTFADPRIGYEALTDKLVEILSSVANKTDLNHDLNNTVKLIEKGGIYETPVPNTKMPAVLVRVSRKTEEVNTMPARVRRDCYIYMELAGIVYYTTNAKESHNECMNLADNVEAIIRNNPQLGGLVDLCELGDVDFDSGVKGEMLVVVFIMTVKFTKRIR